MDQSDERYFLGRLLTMLSRHEVITLPLIKRHLRVFLKTRHQTDTSINEILEKFVRQGNLKPQILNYGRRGYTWAPMMSTEITRFQENQKIAKDLHNSDFDDFATPEQRQKPEGTIEVKQYYDKMAQLAQAIAQQKISEREKEEAFKITQDAILDKNDPFGSKKATEAKE